MKADTEDFSPDTIDIEQLVTDRDAFNKFVYTPPEEAVAELQRRWKDETLEHDVSLLLHHNVPEQFLNGSRVALVRHIITPNYEIRRFIQLTELFENIKPLLVEYPGDKFTSNNELKHSLGKIGFYKGKDSKGDDQVENLTVIHFDSSNGKLISEVKTLWGESLIDFHRSLLDIYMPGLDVLDISSWLHKHATNASGYYLHFMALFVRHGILMENYMLDNEKELRFIKEIFLPVMIRIMKETGSKPLIIALEPTEIESSRFWQCHPFDSKDHVLKKLSSC